jgi:hypothetical protein
MEWTRWGASLIIWALDLEGLVPDLRGGRMSIGLDWGTNKGWLERYPYQLEIWRKSMVQFINKKGLRDIV